MKKSYNENILKYKFENNKIDLKVIVIGNILPVLIFWGLSTNTNQFIQNLHALFCLTSALLIGILYRFYDWKNPMINLTLIATYVSLFLLEYLIFGVPQSIMKISPQLSKGIFLELIIVAFPLGYILLRFVFIIPLFQIFLTSRKFKKV